MSDNNTEARRLAARQEAYDDAENVDKIVRDLADEAGVGAILDIPGVWDCVHEFYVNAALSRIDEEVDEEFDATLQSDIEHAEKIVAGLNEPGCDDAACCWPDCDCNTSETAMFSFGYAEVYQTGEVIASGETVFTVEVP